MHRLTPVFFTIIIAALFCGIIFVIMPIGNFKMTIGFLLNFLITILTIRKVNELLPIGYCIKFFLILQLVPITTLIIYSGLGANLIIPNRLYNAHILDGPYIIVFSLLIPSFTAWVAALIINNWLVSRVSIRNFYSHINKDSKVLILVLFASLPLSLSSIISAYTFDILSYGIHIIGTSMLIMPFFAGRFCKLSTFLLVIWIICLSINGIGNLLMGARFVALFPILLFYIGWTLSQNKIIQTLSLSIGAFLIIPGLLLVGIIGNIRSEIGRDDINMISVQHYKEIVRHAKQASEDISLNFGAAFRRLVPWANIAVPLLSPFPVPYRGFETFLQEIRASSTIYYFDPNGRDSYLDHNLGNFPANEYGFRINESTSVDFGVIADGWSRAGWIGAIIFVFLALLFIGVFEHLILNSHLFRPALKIVYVSVLMSCVFRVGLSPLLTVLRHTILYLILYLILILVIQFFLSSRVARSNEAY